MWFYKHGYIVITINKWLMLFGGLSLFLVLFLLSKDVSSLPIFFSKICTKFLSDYKTLPNFIVSFCLFYFFMSIKLGQVKVINILSSVSFGVYVIHQVPDFHDFLWVKILKIDAWGYSLYYDIMFIIGVLLIYLVCGALDYCRQKLIEKKLLKLKCLDVLFETVNNNLRINNKSFIIK